MLSSLFPTSMRLNHLQKLMSFSADGNGAPVPSLDGEGKRHSKAVATRWLEASAHER